MLIRVRIRVRVRVRCALTFGTPSQVNDLAASDRRLLGTPGEVLKRIFVPAADINNDLNTVFAHAIWLFKKVLAGTALPS